MINITDKTKCSGCAACFSVCGKNAIEMKPDEEGFLYPFVDNSACIKCGLCVKGCPVLNNRPQNKIAKVYAATNKDENVLQKSSSGGMFSLLANYIFSGGGIVFGAAFDENFKVVHKSAQNHEELDALRRSKYIQSEIGETFKQTKGFLDNKRSVLFTGTPCQIAGLKNYLGKDYEELLTADLICHSVVSPEVWEQYLERELGGIISADFRDKTFGWDKSRAVIYLRDKKEISAGNFMLGFGYCLYCRPSCGNCSFKDAAKHSDFTMADFWGVKKVKPETYDKNGVSLLILNSQKASNVFEEIKQNIKYAEIPLEDAIRYNPMFYKSAKLHPKRNEFFKNFESEPLNKLIPRLTYKPFIVKVFNFAKCKIAELIRS
jgi:coenzyme F420-reducing hydrogenase beta subunit